MNLSTLSLALKGANSTLHYLRENGKKKEREIYDSLLEAVREGKLGEVADDATQDELEELFSTARLEAGDVTRDIHDRLDRRRAAFAAAAPDREARHEALKHDLRFQEEKKGSSAGKIIGTVLGIAGAAALASVLKSLSLPEETDRAVASAAEENYTPRHASGPLAG